MEKKEFINKCKKARQLQKEMDAIIYDIFDNLPSEVCNIPSNAENADNVEEAIQCYIHYGEYNPEDIYYEIKNALVDN